MYLKVIGQSKAAYATTVGSITMVNQINSALIQYLDITKERVAAIFDNL